MARSADTYRAAFRNTLRQPRRCDQLKAARIKAGMSRRDYDRLIQNPANRGGDDANS